jgi:hypothetical protein
MEPPRVPGGYMVEREISNAINAVVVDGVSIRSAIDDSNKRISREIDRKLTDFGYTSNGEFIKPFVLPDIGLIEKWLE